MRWSPALRRELAAHARWNWREPEQPSRWRRGTKQSSPKWWRRLKLRAGKAAAFALDVASEESIKAWAKAVLERFGKVEILVNNAGITRDGLMMAMKCADWDDVLATNLTGAFLLTQALLRPMLKNRWGRIINISSVVGRTGQAGQVNYAASKAGLIGFTRSMAREVASRGITVNAVAPGYIETPMTAILNEKQRDGDDGADSAGPSRVRTLRLRSRLCFWRQMEPGTSPATCST